MTKEQANELLDADTEIEKQKLLVHDLNRTLMAMTGTMEGMDALDVEMDLEAAMQRLEELKARRKQLQQEQKQ